MSDKFIQTQILYPLIDWEPYILLACLLALTWIFYKMFLDGVSEERHQSLRTHFKSLLRQFIVLSLLFIAFMFMKATPEDLAPVLRLQPYVAIITVIWGAAVFVKTSRLLVLQYLFLGSMRAGVPLLLVNIFSLLLSIVLIVWGLNHIFGLDLGPLMATSAAFSIILGLALQDTLGNLFAGISLQIDKCYEIGDWLEVVQGIQRCVGQVKEITWRSTVLVGLADEEIVLPNRTMANAQISNYSPEGRPIVRGQVFRLKFNVDLTKAKEVLERALVEISDVRALPGPYAYIQETTESYVAMKVIYYIDNFGSQYSIGDRVLTKAIDALRSHGIELAHNYLEIEAKSFSHDMRP